MMEPHITVRRALLPRVVMGAAAAFALAGCSLGGEGATPTVPTAKAARGDVVRDIRGVGRIVPASSATPVAGSATQGSGAGSAAAAAPADAVFATVSGHLARYLVTPGERLSAGQPLALLDDGGAAAAALDQARSELETARLELQQKQTSDPARGLPPSASELTAARVAVAAAERRLRLIERPGAIDVTTAQLELRKAEADLTVLQHGAAPLAVAAAERAVGVAYRKLEQAGAPVTTAELLAAQQELLKARVELEALQRGPGATAVEAAKLAVTLAEQKLAELPSGVLPSELTQARLELTRARAEWEALQGAPSATAAAAARAAVDLAAARLADATGPPSALATAAARAELDRARSELQTLRLRADPASARAARIAVKLARQKLVRVSRPEPISRDAARVELTRAVAELETLRRRGAPAGPVDRALARLKVRSAEARVAAARDLTRRLIVEAPRAGTVTALLDAPGAPVDPSTPIALVADLDHLVVDVDLSEFDVAQVRRGQAAVVSVDALGGRVYTGTVLSEALTGVQNGGVVTFPVRIGIGRVAGVKPGMNVSVRIVVAKRRGVLHVPLEAVAQDGERSSVTVVDAAGARSVRPVKLGLADNKLVEIRSGLEPGERVLLETGGDGG